MKRYRIYMKSGNSFVIVGRLADDHQKSYEAEMLNFKFVEMHPDTDARMIMQQVEAIVHEPVLSELEASK